MDISKCRKYSISNTISEDSVVQLYNIIFNYFRRLCNQNDSEDLTQETVLKIYSHLSQYKDQSTFRAWCLKIAYHTYIDWKRKKQPIYISDWWEISGNCKPEVLLEKEEEYVQVYDAVEKLSEENKQIIALRFYCGLSTAECAYLLQVSKSCVKYRVKAALSQIKFMLKKPI